MRPCIIRHQVNRLPKLIGVPDANTSLQGSSKLLMIDYERFEIDEIQLSYHPRNIWKQKVTSSASATTCFKEMLRAVFDEGTIRYKEYFYVLYLRRNNDVIGYRKVSEGGLSGTVVDIREILGVALKCGASNLILCHNHPSGNLNPSDQDIRLTKKIQKACQVMDLHCLDHIIITSNGYSSLMDKGIM